MLRATVRQLPSRSRWIHPRSFSDSSVDHQVRDEPGAHVEHKRARVREHDREYADSRPSSGMPGERPQSDEPEVRAEGKDEKRDGDVHDNKSADEHAPAPRPPMEAGGSRSSNVPDSSSLEARLSKKIVRAERRRVLVNETMQGALKELCQIEMALDNLTARSNRHRDEISAEFDQDELLARTTFLAEEASWKAALRIFLASERKWEQGVLVSINRIGKHITGARIFRERKTERQPDLGEDVKRFLDSKDFQDLMNTKRTYADSISRFVMAQGRLIATQKRQLEACESRWEEFIKTINAELSGFADHQRAFINALQLKQRAERKLSGAMSRLDAIREKREKAFGDLENTVSERSHALHADRAQAISNIYDLELQDGQS